MCLVSFQTSVLALLGFPLSKAPPKGPGAGGWLLVVLGDLVAAAGLWLRAPHPSPSSGYPFPEFCWCSSSYSVSPCSRWSVTATSSACHQPDVTAHGPAVLGTGALSAPWVESTGHPPDLQTTYELVFQAQHQPTVEIPKLVPRQCDQHRGRKEKPALSHQERSGGQWVA